MSYPMLIAGIELIRKVANKDVREKLIEIECDSAGSLVAAYEGSMVELRNFEKKWDGATCGV